MIVVACVCHINVDHSKTVCDCARAVESDKSADVRF